MVATVKWAELIPWSGDYTKKRGKLKKKPRSYWFFAPTGSKLKVVNFQQEINLFSSRGEERKHTILSQVQTNKLAGEQQNVFREGC